MLKHKGKTTGNCSDLSVLVVIGSLKVGGTERHLTQILPELFRRGIDPTVYLLGPRGPAAEALEKTGISIVDGTTLAKKFEFLPRHLRGLFIHLSNILQLSAYLNRSRPTICHCFLPLACVVGGLAATLAGQSKIVASRRSLNHYQVDHPYRSIIERYLLSRMSAVLGNSLAVVEQLLEEGVPLDRIGLIYNGIDSEQVDRRLDKEAIRKREGISSDSLVIVISANLISYKGHADLFTTLGAIQDQLPKPWVLLCVGRDDGLGQDLRAEAESLRIAENVRFLGEREDVFDLYRAADMGVLCSHEEGFSNVLLEAMVSHLPMVVTNVGGNPEAVTDGDSGLVVPTKNVEALGNAILELALNEERRFALAEAGRKRVESRFTLSRCIDCYENLYRGLVLAPSLAVEKLIQDGGSTDSALIS